MDSFILMFQVLPLGSFQLNGIGLFANSLLPTKKFQREAEEWRIGDYLLIKTYNRLEKFQPKDIMLVTL